MPLLAEGLSRGELSYAKVRALTRVATPETEARLLAVGRADTAAHVERIVRGWRCVDRRAKARETAKRHAGRALHVYRDDDGMVTVRGRLEPEVGALLMQALAAAREALYQRARVSPDAAGAGPGRHRGGRVRHGGHGEETRVSWLQEETTPWPKPCPPRSSVSSTAPTSPISPR